MDVYTRPAVVPAPDVSRLEEGLAGSWPANGSLAGNLQGEAKLVESPFGKAVSFSGAVGFGGDPSQRHDECRRRRFPVAAWIRPTQLRNAGIVARGGEGKHGWYLDLADRGAVRSKPTERTMGLTGHWRPRRGRFASTRGSTSQS